MTLEIASHSPVRIGGVAIQQEFCGPPGFGNGGYVCAKIAKIIPGPAKVVLKAPAPLGVPLDLWAYGDEVRLNAPDGSTIGVAQIAQASCLRTPAEPPSYLAAETSGQDFPGLHRDFHSGCYCCRREPKGSSLRAFVGQRHGRPDGEVCGVWNPPISLADHDGLIAVEAIWGVLDCPGAVAWVVTEGGQGGWLGTMTCAIKRRPFQEEPCIITAWRLGQSGRKRLSGTALHSASGELLANSEQVWLWPSPNPPAL